MPIVVQHSPSVARQAQLAELAAQMQRQQQEQAMLQQRDWQVADQQAAFDQQAKMQEMQGQSYLASQQAQNQGRLDELQLRADLEAQSRQSQAVQPGVLPSPGQPVAPQAPGGRAPLPGAVKEPENPFLNPTVLREGIRSQSDLQKAVLEAELAKRGKAQDAGIDDRKAMRDYLYGLQERKDEYYSSMGLDNLKHLRRLDLEQVKAGAQTRHKLSMLQNATAMIEGRDDMDDDAKSKALQEINRQAEILLTGVDLNAPAPKLFTEKDYFAGEETPPGSIVAFNFDGREVPYIINDKGLPERLDTGIQDDARMFNDLLKTYYELRATNQDFKNMYPQPVDYLKSMSGGRSGAGTPEGGGATPEAQAAPVQNMDQRMADPAVQAKVTQQITGMLQGAMELPKTEATATPSTIYDGMDFPKHEVSPQQKQVMQAVGLARLHGIPVQTMRSKSGRTVYAFMLDGKPVYIEV